MNEKLYTVPEVARTFSVTPATVRVWLDDDYIEGFKVGRGVGQWRIKESEVKRIANERHGSGDQG